MAIASVLNVYRLHPCITLLRYVLGNAAAGNSHPVVFSSWKAPLLGRFRKQALNLGLACSSLDAYTEDHVGAHGNGSLGKQYTG